MRKPTNKKKFRKAVVKALFYGGYVQYTGVSMYTPPGEIELLRDHFKHGRKFSGNK